MKTYGPRSSGRLKSKTGIQHFFFPQRLLNPEEEAGSLKFFVSSFSFKLGVYKMECRKMVLFNKLQDLVWIPEHWPQRIRRQCIKPTLRESEWSPTWKQIHSLKWIGVILSVQIHSGSKHKSSLEQGFFLWRSVNLGGVMDWIVFFQNP